MSAAAISLFDLPVARRRHRRQDKGFETYTVKSMAAVVAELEKAGFGFGKQGASPGQFVDFPGNPTSNGTGFYVAAPRPA
jgi:hypothetical protein